MLFHNGLQRVNSFIIPSATKFCNHVFILMKKTFSFLTIYNSMVYLHLFARKTKIKKNKNLLLTFRGFVSFLTCVQLSHRNTSTFLSTKRKALLLIILKQNHTHTNACMYTYLHIKTYTCAHTYQATNGQI